MQDGVSINEVLLNRSDGKSAVIYYTMAMAIIYKDVGRNVGSSRWGDNTLPCPQCSPREDSWDSAASIVDAKKAVSQCLS